MAWKRRRRHACVHCTVSPPPSGGLLRALAFGPGQVLAGQQEILRRRGDYPQLRELFFYFRLSGPRTLAQVALDFWPEAGPARAANAVYCALSNLRKSTGRPVVAFREGRYAWNPAVPCWCDADEFAQLLDEAAARGEADAVALRERAVALYRGAFLSGCDRDWCAGRREELAGRCCGALLELGALDLERQDWPAAQERFRRALRVDELCEEAYRGLMRACIAAGERGQAARAYQRCCRRLAELGVAPSPETMALYRSMA